MKRCCLNCVSVLVTLLSGWSARSEDASTEAVFNSEIQPILAENCFACHGFDARSRQAGLRLDTFEDATADRDGEHVIAPGFPEKSTLMARILSEDPDLVMPPPETGKKLSPAQKDKLRDWIASGARYGRHWSFIPPVQPEPPAMPEVSHAVDRFVRKRLAETGLSPSSPASPAVLIRRVSLDLVGLPPEPSEIDAFLTEFEQDRNAAWIRLVDRLLASPHYGERWGRWWLDQARYADSNGYSIDAPRDIWRYRDWVVEAFNSDMPFDQFTIEQLAGDLVPGSTDWQKVATGFHRNTQINQEGGIDREQFRIDSVFDRVSTTGTVWLGLTIGCAQCHDHKFDPIAQKEYYQLFAFLNNQDEPSIRVFDRGVDGTALTNELKEAEKQLNAWLDEHASTLTDWETSLTADAKHNLAGEVSKVLEIAVGKRNFAQKLSLSLASPVPDDALRTLAARHREISEVVSRTPTTMVLRELAEPRVTSILIKGDFTRPAEPVTPGTPAVLHPFENLTGKSSRLDLAHWIVSRKNPLTARVLVNRVWQQYFGRGIVETENDFGMLGSRPTHPALLDWLACEFVNRQWSLKELHRLIVTSETYQQSSHERTDLRDHDPNNELLGRQKRLRLDGEVVRDTALTACGLLSRKMGGPPVFPPIPEGVMNLGQSNRAWTASVGEDRHRRGLYTFMYRATPAPSLNVFDVPDGYSSCTRRNRSNTPLQSLTLMNDTAFFEFAVALERIVGSEGLQQAFRRCTGRFPEDEELQILQRLDSLTAARVMLNLDETITRE